MTSKRVDHYIIIIGLIWSIGDRHVTLLPGFLMKREVHSHDEFRGLVNRCARESPAQWEASRRVILEHEFPETVARLLDLTETSELPALTKESLRLLLDGGEARRVQDLDSELLRTLTGFPPAKAMRALCVFFGLIDRPGSKWPSPSMSTEDVERRIRESADPFDLLRHVEVASVLDLGAGDLSFAEELAERYVPELQQQSRRLILHCLDRIDPHSKLGGPLHPSQERLRILQEKLGSSFAYYGNQDMFALHPLEEAGRLASRYAIVTCWAPATPAFAYEPSRLSRSVIAEELYRTKGASKLVRFQGEPALEVRHGDRRLLFPPWKFEVIGPLALLDLMADRGFVCVLGAVDDQVFWELLAQLLEEPRYRPTDLPFTAANRRGIFGSVHEALDRLPIGHSIDLADLGALRRRTRPGASVPSGKSPTELGGGFRYVRISRGATFPGIPASSTARLFPGMVEETAPWLLTLVPA